MGGIYKFAESGEIVKVASWSEYLRDNPLKDPSEALPASELTWARICGEEPELAELQRELLEVKDDPAKPRFCANVIWYGYGPGRTDSPRRRLGKLVGWEARNPKLRSEVAYDVAYDKLYALLSDCRDCLCA